VGLFRPYDRGDEAPAATPVTTDNRGGAAKNKPTPTRRQAQAARMEALHPKLTRRQASAQDRAAAEQRRRKDIAAVENQPERVLMRNFIDARRSPTEFLWPVLLILMAASFFTGTNPTVYLIVFSLMWTALLGSIIICWWYWQGYKRELAARHPNASTKGLVMQFVSRMVSFRRMRNPPPTLKPGDSY